MSQHSHGSPSTSNASEGASPSSAAPSGRRGNDSLWKRARRTLGTSSLTFLQPQSRPQRGNKSDSGGPAPPSKRREQVRHAQRTHRQRTQNYIKTLESEVVRLRNSENALLQEKDNLQGKVEILRTTCLLAGVKLPAGIQDTAKDLSQRPLSQEPATVSLHADDMSHQRLHVNWPSSQASIGAQGHQLQGLQSHVPTAQGSGVQHISPQSAASLPNDFSLQPLSFAMPSTQVVYTERNPLLDTPDIAIDFVLALEHPCMPHIPHPSGKSHDPSNHILLASTPLVASSASPPQSNSQWSASAAMIKELLNLSSSINLKGELTPVEAWHRLREHPNFWKMDLETFGILKRELSYEVKCCGFGAVIEESVYWQIVNRVIANSQTQNA